MATIEPYETSTGAKRYMVRYRTPQRTQTKKRGFRSVRDAKEFASTVEVDKMTGRYVAPKLGLSTIGELGPGWLARQVRHKPSTAARTESLWRIHVEPKWGRRRIDSIRRSEVQTWVAALAMSASSVTQAHTVLASILDDAVTDRRLAENPARGVKLPRKVGKEKNYLTRVQVAALAGESKHPEIVLLLATTGLRWGEMAALRVRDIDLGRGRLMVARSASKVNSRSVIGTPKGHQVRNIAAPVTVLKMLTPLMAGKSLDELLWCRPDGQPLRPPTTTHWFGGAVKRCQAADKKFPRVTVHELRHTAASLLIQSGANVKTLQRQLGHKTATMTLDQYGHLFDDDLDDVADKMDDIIADGRAHDVPNSPELGE
jgi:integrase